MSIYFSRACLVFLPQTPPASRSCRLSRNPSLNMMIRSPCHEQSSGIHQKKKNGPSSTQKCFHLEHNSFNLSLNVSEQSGTNLVKHPFIISGFISESDSTVHSSCLESRYQPNSPWWSGDLQYGAIALFTTRHKQWVRPQAFPRSTRHPYPDQPHNIWNTWRP